MSAWKRSGIAVAALVVFAACARSRADEARCATCHVPPVTSPPAAAPGSPAG